MGKNLKSKLTEFKINIEGAEKKYVDGLILGLVHAGHQVYFGWDKQDVIFTGWLDEVTGDN